MVTPIGPAADGRLLREFVAVLDRSSLPGMVDLTPAAASVLLHFDLGSLASADEMLERTNRLLDSVALDSTHEPCGAPIEIPFCGETEHAPDLAACAQHAGLAPDDYLDRFSSLTFEAAFVGFMPGFAYLRGLAPPLQVPRLSTPRVRVPAGSIAVAGEMAGVYPFASPGGWRLIGRTPLVIFDAARSQPALIEAGCQVRFVRIDPVEYEAIMRGQEPVA